MNTRYAIDCAGISKTFVQRTIPIMRLQDKLLRLGRRGAVMRVNALHPTDLRVEHGEWIGVYGPNGSGKTTLLKMIAGLLRPDSGKIDLHGTLSTFFDLGIGFHPERAARENIYLHGLLNGLHPKEIAAMTEEILAFADIGGAADLPLKCYSTGMKLRLAFAASAHVDADIYLFDEILAVGDVDFKKKCRIYMESLRQKGKTVILVGHNLTVLQHLSDRILVLSQGKMTSLQAVPKSADPAMKAPDVFYTNDTASV